MVARAARRDQHESGRAAAIRSAAAAELGARCGEDLGEYRRLLGDLGRHQRAGQSLASLVTEMDYTNRRARIAAPSRPARAPSGESLTGRRLGRQRTSLASSSCTG